MKKQLLSFFLTLLPLMANAFDAKIDGIYYYFSGDEAIVTYLNYQDYTFISDYSGSIVIPKTVTYNGKTYSVTRIDEYAFHQCTNLTSVTIPEGVTSIGYEAFSYCIGLTSVTIPNSVTSIGYGVFSYCSNLTSVTIGNSVTSIGSNAFWNCTSLKSIIIPNSVTSIGSNAFYECYFTSDSFVNYSSLTSDNNWTATICDEETSDGLLIKDNIVVRCRPWATAVSIPESVTSIGWRAFDGCNSLTSVTIPEGVTNIGNSAFSHCRSLTTVTIPNSLTSIGNYVFYECSSLTSVNIPNSVTSIGEYAFSSCSDLTSIFIPNSVTNIVESAFWHCGGLTSIKVETGNTKYDSRNNCNAIIETVTNTLITGCNNTIIPNSVTSIGEWAFSHCSSLTSVTIPNSVTSIGNDAFWGCMGLTSVTIPNSVTSIGSSAFSYCTSLTDVICYAEDVPNTNGNAFYKSPIASATLHVPVKSIEQYKATEPWSMFGTIKTLDDDTPEPPKPEKCATPTISYRNGELAFNCETEGAEFVSEITDSDIKKNYTAKIKLSVTYNLTVYATKTNYENSDTIQATLCWIDTEPKTEGIVDEDAVTEVKALPVLIQSHGGTISVQGLDAGTLVSIYSTDGKEQGFAVVADGATTIRTSLQPGSIAVVKIGERSIKVLMK